MCQSAPGHPVPVSVLWWLLFEIADSLSRWSDCSLCAPSVFSTGLAASYNVSCQNQTRQLCGCDVKVGKVQILTLTPAPLPVLKSPTAFMTTNVSSYGSPIWHHTLSNPYLFFNLHMSTIEVNNYYGLSLHSFRMTIVIKIMKTKINLNKAQKFIIYLIENKKRPHYIDKSFNVV